MRGLFALGFACAIASAACDRPESKTETTSANQAPTQKEPDNTRVNERDRNMDSTTPMTQGNAESEVKITAEIRRAIMGDDTLGFDAKNVKIVTVGTKVTLRGPVANAREKAAIDAHARKAVGVTELDDELEIAK